MAFDPFADPFSTYNPSFGDQPLPKLKPEVAEDWLDQIGDDLIGGLGYIGSVLDKPGRAVRGILDTVTGGGPQSLRETLAILPFSDSIGLTREEDRVSGEKLLRNVGLITEPDNNEFDENDLAGIAAEIAFDPLSYLGIGTLTKGGKALQKAGGKVNVGFKARAAGADFSEANLKSLLGQGDLTARDFVTKADNVIPESVQGVNPRFKFGEESLVPDQTLNYLDPTPVTPANALEAIEAIRSGKGTVTPGRYTSLDGFIDGLPSYKVLEAGPNSAVERLVKATKEATDDATRLGSTITFGKAPLGLDRLLGIEPFRIESGVLDRGIDALSAGIQGSKLGAGVSRLFDSRVGNARTSEVQSVQREVGAPAREAYRAEALEQSMGLRQKGLDGFAPLVNSGNEAEAMRFARQLAEDIDPVTGASGTKYGAARTLAEEEAQLASRPPTIPVYANLLEEMKATGAIDDIRNTFLGRQDMAKDMVNLMKTAREAEAVVGVKSTELLDQFADYLPRQRTTLPRKEGENVFSYMDRALKDAIRTSHEGQLQRKAILTDIPGGTTQIDDWVRNGEALRMMPTDKRVAYFVEELTGFPATTNPNVLEKAKGLADAVMDWKGREKVGLFDNDIFASIERRLLGGATAKGGMDATLETVRRFAMTEAEAQARNIPFTRVSDFVSQEGFSRQAADLARRDLRLNSTLGLKGMVIPQDIAADLAKVQKAWTNPEEVQGIVRLWDTALQMFKGAVTYPFPAFHVRNVGSGIYNMWRDGAASPSAMRDAYKVLTSNADLPGMSRQQIVKEAVANRVAFTPHTKQFGDMGQAGDSFIQGLPGKLKGEGLVENLAAGAKANAPQSWKDIGFVVRQGKAAGSFVEDWIRLSHYLAKRQQGFEPAAAASAVRKYQYDYSQFTQAERNVFKRLIPWWSFSRSNLPPILEDLATKPAKLAGSIRGATTRPDDQFVPQYISEGPAIPIPGGPPGSDRYLASLGLPFEDEMIRTLGNLLQGKATRAVQQQIGTLAPPIKFPLEQAFGIQAHTGRRLDDLKPTPAAELLSALTPLSPQGANQVIGLTPLARFGSVSNQIADERKGPLEKIINLGTGAWITDVDATKARNVEVRDMLEDLLRKNQGVTNFDKFYVKPENLAKLSPQELQAYMLYRTLEDKAKEQAAKRKQQLPLPGGF